MSRSKTRKRKKKLLAFERTKENRKAQKTNPYFLAIYKALQRNKIKFRTEYPVYVRNTPFFYLLDFFLYELGAAIELDGKHHEDPVQRFRDSCKDRYCFEHLNTVVIRIPSKEVEPYLDLKFPILNYLKDVI